MKTLVLLAIICTITLPLVATQRYFCEAYGFVRAFNGTQTLTNCEGIELFKLAVLEATIIEPKHYPGNWALKFCGSTFLQTTFNTTATRKDLIFANGGSGCIDLALELESKYEFWITLEYRIRASYVNSSFDEPSKGTIWPAKATPRKVKWSIGFDSPSAGILKLYVSNYLSRVYQVDPNAGEFVIDEELPAGNATFGLQVGLSYMYGNEFFIK